MDATITNLSTERVFIPGPQLDMAPTGDPAGGDVKLWSEITVTDIDSNTRIKELVVAGTISVQMDAELWPPRARSTSPRCPCICSQTSRLGTTVGWPSCRMAGRVLRGLGLVRACRAITMQQQRAGSPSLATSLSPSRWLAVRRSSWHRLRWS